MSDKKKKEDVVEEENEEQEQEEEEEEKVEKKEKKTAKKATKKKPAKEEAVPTRYSHRKPKPVEKLTYDGEGAKKKEVEFYKGKGTKLVDIPNVETELSKTKTKEPFLKKFHRILYPGCSAVEATVKKNIREFSGFSSTGDKHTEEVADKLKKWDMKELRSLADLLDVDRASSKDDQVENLTKFLNKPQDSGKEKKKGSSGKGKRSESSGSGSGKGKGKKKEKKKTGIVTAFFLFSREKRPGVREENPEAKVTEIAKILGGLWGELSDKEKEDYKVRAKELSPKESGSGSGKGKGKKRKATTKKTGKSKKQKKSEDEEKEGGDEEEEEAEEEEAEEEEAEEKEEKEEKVAADKKKKGDAKKGDAKKGDAKKDDTKKDDAEEEEAEEEEEEAGDDE